MMYQNLIIYYSGLFSLLYFLKTLYFKVSTKIFLASTLLLVAFWDSLTFLLFYQQEADNTFTTNVPWEIINLPVYILIILGLLLLILSISYVKKASWLESREMLDAFKFLFIVNFYYHWISSIDGSFYFFIALPAGIFLVSFYVVITFILSKADDKIVTMKSERLLSGVFWVLVILSVPVMFFSNI